jgi:putative hydrolase of the HAD superfamily
MVKKTQIKAVIFDIGGVLSLGKYALHPKRGHRELGVHNYLAKNLKVSTDQYFDSIDTYYVKSIMGEIPEKKAIKKISKNLKTTPKKLIELYTKAYKKNFKINNALYRHAFDLKSKGYKIAILSDQWHLSKRSPQLINQKLINKFDSVVLSCDVGVRKPKPKIYRILLKKLKIPAKNCVFIDNQTWNLKPAKELGFKTILFKNNKQTFQKLEKMGVK